MPSPGSPQNHSTLRSLTICALTRSRPRPAPGTPRGVPGCRAPAPAAGRPGPARRSRGHLRHARGLAQPADDGVAEVLRGEHDHVGAVPEDLVGERVGGAVRRGEPVPARRDVGPRRRCGLLRRPWAASRRTSTSAVRLPAPGPARRSRPAGRCRRGPRSSPPGRRCGPRPGPGRAGRPAAQSGRCRGPRRTNGRGRTPPPRAGGAGWRCWCRRRSGQSNRTGVCVRVASQSGSKAGSLN